MRKYFNAWNNYERSFVLSLRIPECFDFCVKYKRTVPHCRGITILMYITIANESIFWMTLGYYFLHHFRNRPSSMCNLSSSAQKKHVSSSKSRNGFSKLSWNTDEHLLPTTNLTPKESNLSLAINGAFILHKICLK